MKYILIEIEDESPIVGAIEEAGGTIIDRKEDDGEYGGPVIYFP